MGLDVNGNALPNHQPKEKQQKEHKISYETSTAKLAELIDGNWDAGDPSLKE